MLPRSRFESEWEYLRRLEDEIREVELQVDRLSEQAYELAYSTGYDSDEPDPDPEMECESRSH